MQEENSTSNSPSAATTSPKQSWKKKVSPPISPAADKENDVYDQPNFTALPSSLLRDSMTYAAAVREARIGEKGKDKDMTPRSLSDFTTHPFSDLLRPPQPCTAFGIRYSTTYNQSQSRDSNYNSDWINAPAQQDEDDYDYWVPSSENEDFSIIARQEADSDVEMIDAEPQQEKNSLNEDDWSPGGSFEDIMDSILRETSSSLPTPTPTVYKQKQTATRGRGRPRGSGRGRGQHENGRGRGQNGSSRGRGQQRASATRGRDDNGRGRGYRGRRRSFGGIPAFPQLLLMKGKVLKEKLEPLTPHGTLYQYATDALNHFVSITTRENASRTHAAQPHQENHTNNSNNSNRE